MKRQWQVFGAVFSASMIGVSTVLTAGCGTKEVEKNVNTEKRIVEKSAQTGDESTIEEVKNNGSYMVTVGDSVYFRDYPVASIESVTIGEGNIGYLEDGASSYISCYDKISENVTQVAEDTYGGLLYYGNGSIYTSRRADDETNTYGQISLDNGTVKELGEGIICGISQDGSLLAIEQREKNETKQLLIIDTKNQQQVATIEKENSTVHYIGFYNNSVVYELEDQTLYDKKVDQKVSSVSDYYAVYHLYQQDLDNGSVLSLGTITFPFMEDSEAESVEVANGNVTIGCEREPGFTEGIISGNRVGVSYQVAEGTGAVFNYGYIASATLGEENSIDEAEYIENTSKENAKGTETYESMPKIWFDQNQKLKYGEYQPGSVYISGETLFYMDENGEEQEVVKEYAKGSDMVNASEGEIVDYADNFSVHQNVIYAVREKIERDEKNDFGWRATYKLHGLEYCKIDIADGTVEVFQTEKAK